MDLFNEYNNLIFRALPFITSELIDGKELNKYNVMDLFFKANSDMNEDSEAFENDSHISGLTHQVSDSDFFIDYDEKTAVINAKYPFSAKLPLVFSRHEKEFIKLMLCDEESRAFLDTALIQKLENALKDHDISHITDNYTECFTGKPDIDADKRRPVLGVITEAMRQGRKIKYIYASKSGEYNGTASPYRLSYSLRDQVLRLAARPDDGSGRFILMNIDRFISAELTDENIDMDIDKFYDGQKRRLILRVDNDDGQRNILERCLRLFSSYRRQTEYDRENNCFYVKIDFYLFDKDKIVGDILSLGSGIIVTETLKPAKKKGVYIKDDELDIRSEIINELRKMSEMLNGQEKSIRI